MSASSKPPRGWSARPPSTQRVAKVLLDAETFGDRRASAKAGIARRTLQTWRKQWGASPVVVAEMNRLRKALDDGWVLEGRRARRALIDRVQELAEKSKNLTAATKALRTLHEVVLSHEIVNAPPDDQHKGADQPADSGAPQGGPGAGPGDAADEDDLDGGQGGPLDVC